MDDSDREGEETSSKHKEEDADRVDGTDDDRHKVAHNLERSKLE